MSGQEQNVARQTLAAFAAGRVDKDRVMRTLVGYDGWFVPALFARAAIGDAVFDRTILLSSNFDAAPPDLTIFTDPEAVLLAYGQPLGPFVGRIAGHAVFGALDDRYASLRVNPACPQE